MSGTERDDLRLLIRRAEDLLKKSARGEVGETSFLTPREAHILREYLKGHGALPNALFWGGYKEAERTKLFLLPEYVGAFSDGKLSVQELDLYTGGALSQGVAAVRIKGSGYRDLTHRDYLGSLLALGLERNVLGDILAEGSFEAVVFCAGRIVAFLCDQLKRVGNDAVKVTVFEVPEGYTGNRSFLPISDTVASQRLDCVVGALTGLSRDGAQNAVRSGLCEVDFETEQKPDRILTPPCQISVRGYGRYVLRAFDGETKKGRLRLRADKYV